MGGRDLTSTSHRHPQGIRGAENLLPSLLAAPESLVYCTVEESSLGRALEGERCCLCYWAINGVKSDVPEFLGAAALQALTGVVTSQVFILQPCPKGQNWRSRMGVAVSDTQ